MIKIVEGNLLEGPENIKGQQVNTKGIMGAGLGKQIKLKHKIVYNEYKKYCNKFSEEELMGDCQIVWDGKTAIANLFGQKNYGIHAIQTDYQALRKALEKLRDYAEENKLTISLPYEIGCGLAGGNWSIVRNIINETFSKYDVTLYRLGRK